MATGDVTGQDRPRLVDRQRLDRVDVDATSGEARLSLDHITRALLGKLFATNGAAVGEVWTGGSVTVNPTGPADGKLRVNTELFIGVDANGRAVVKQAGITLTANIPVGTYQVYLYDAEITTQTAVKRAITAVPPFAEVSIVTDTKYTASCDVFIRAGTAATIVKDDVIGARTTPLLFLGIAVNAAGVVSFDNSAQTNRLTTVSTAPVFPTGPTTTGDIRTITDYLRALAYSVSRDRWLNSTHFTPSISNNQGAYTEPPAGLDLTYRKTYQTITIGSGVGLNKGDFDVSDYVDATACLQAAFNSLSASGGGVIFIKPYAVLTMTGNLTVPINTNIYIEGVPSYASIVFGTNKILFAGSGSFFGLRNLRVTAAGTFIESANNKLIFDCVDINMTAAPTAAVKLTTAVDGCRFTRCKFNATVAADSATLTSFIDAGSVAVRNTLIDSCTFSMTTHVQRYITMNDVRDDVCIKNCILKFATDGTPTAPAVAIVWSTTVNDKDGDTCGRMIRDCTFVGSLTNAGQAFLSGIQLNAISYVTVSGCDYRNIINSVEYVCNNSVTGFLSLVDCIFRQGSVIAVTGLPTSKLKSISLRNNVLDYGQITVTCGELEEMNMDSCTFNNPFISAPCAAVSTVTARGLRITNNSFVTPVNQSLSGILRILTDLNTGGIQDLLLHGNRFVGGGSAVTDNCVLGVQIHGRVLEAVNISNNTFKDMQNVAYTGSANTNGAGGFRVIEFRAYTVNGLQVQSNQFTDIASSYTVAGLGVLAFGRCIRFAPHIDATQTGSWRGVSIHNNIFGTDNDLAGPFTFDGPSSGAIALHSCSICDNQIYYQYKSGVVYPWLADIPVITHDQSEVNSINFANNYLHPYNNTAASMSRHVLGLGPPAGSALRIQNLYVRENIIDIWPTDFGYNVAGGYGIASYYNSIKQLIFSHNSCGGPDKIRTSGFVTPSASIPAVPVAATAWPDNNFIKTA